VGTPNELEHPSKEKPLMIAYVILNSKGDFLRGRSKRNCFWDKFEKARIYTHRHVAKNSMKQLARHARLADGRRTNRGLTWEIRKVEVKLCPQ
jgi:hypothetical protein